MFPAGTKLAWHCRSECMGKIQCQNCRKDWKDDTSHGQCETFSEQLKLLHDKHEILHDKYGTLNDETSQELGKTLHDNCESSRIRPDFLLHESRVCSKTENSPTNCFCHLPNCWESFSDWKCLETHLKDVHQIENNICPVCALNLNSVQSLQNHMFRIHRSITPWQCPDCRLVTHDTVTERLSRQCHKCYKIYSATSSFKRHISKCDASTFDYACFRCRRAFTEQSKAIIHLTDECKYRSKNGIGYCFESFSIVIPFVCDFPFCNAQFPSHREMNKHFWNTHAKGGKLTKLTVTYIVNKIKNEMEICHICGRECFSRRSFTQHLKRVHGLKDHARCPKCHAIHKKNENGLLFCNTISTSLRRKNDLIPINKLFNIEEEKDGEFDLFDDPLHGPLQDMQVSSSDTDFNDEVTKPLIGISEFCLRGEIPKDDFVFEHVDSPLPNKESSGGIADLVVDGQATGLNGTTLCQVQSGDSREPVESNIFNRLFSELLEGNDTEQFPVYPIEKSFGSPSKELSKEGRARSELSLNPAQHFDGLEDFIRSLNGVEAVTSQDSKGINRNIAESVQRNCSSEASTSKPRKESKGNSIIDQSCDQKLTDFNTITKTMLEQMRISSPNHAAMFAETDFAQGTSSTNTTCQGLNAEQANADNNISKEGESDCIVYETEKFCGGESVVKQPFVIPDLYSGPSQAVLEGSPILTTTESGNDHLTSTCSEIPDSPSFKVLLRTCTTESSCSESAEAEKETYLSLSDLECMDVESGTYKDEYSEQSPSSEYFNDGSEKLAKILESPVKGELVCPKEAAIASNSSTSSVLSHSDVTKEEGAVPSLAQPVITNWQSDLLLALITRSEPNVPIIPLNTVTNIQMDFPTMSGSVVTNTQIVPELAQTVISSNRDGPLLAHSTITDNRIDLPGLSFSNVTDSQADVPTMSQKTVTKNEENVLNLAHPANASKKAVSATLTASFFTSSKIVPNVAQSSITTSQTDYLVPHDVFKGNTCMSSPSAVFPLAQKAVFNDESDVVDEIPPSAMFPPGLQMERTCPSSIRHAGDHNNNCLVNLGVGDSQRSVQRQTGPENVNQSAIVAISKPAQANFTIITVTNSQSDTVNNAQAVLPRIVNEQETFSDLKEFTKEGSVKEDMVESCNKLDIVETTTCCSMKINNSTTDSIAQETGIQRTVNQASEAVTQVTKMGGLKESGSEGVCDKVSIPSNLGHKDADGASPSSMALCQKGIVKALPEEGQNGERQLQQWGSLNKSDSRTSSILKDDDKDDDEIDPELDMGITMVIRKYMAQNRDTLDGPHCKKSAFSGKESCLQSKNVINNACLETSKQTQAPVKGRSSLVGNMSSVAAKNDQKPDECLISTNRKMVENKLICSTNSISDVDISSDILYKEWMAEKPKNSVLANERQVNLMSKLFAKDNTESRVVEKKGCAENRPTRFLDNNARKLSSDEIRMRLRRVNNIQLPPVKKPRISASESGRSDMRPKNTTPVSLDLTSSKLSLAHCQNRSKQATANVSFSSECNTTKTTTTTKSCDQGDIPLSSKQTSSKPTNGLLSNRQFETESPEKLCDSEVPSFGTIEDKLPVWENLLKDNGSSAANQVPSRLPKLANYIPDGLRQKTSREKIFESWRAFHVDKSNVHETAKQRKAPRKKSAALSTNVQPIFEFHKLSDGVSKRKAENRKDENKSSGLDTICQSGGKQSDSGNREGSSVVCKIRSNTLSTEKDATTSLAGNKRRKCATSETSPTVNLSCVKKRKLLHGSPEKSYETKTVTGTTTKNRKMTASKSGSAESRAQMDKASTENKVGTCMGRSSRTLSDPTSENAKVQPRFMRSKSCDTNLESKIEQSLLNAENLIVEMPEKYRVDSSSITTTICIKTLESLSELDGGVTDSESIVNQSSSACSSDSEDKERERKILEKQAKLSELREKIREMKARIARKRKNRSTLRNQVSRLKERYRLKGRSFIPIDGNGIPNKRFKDIDTSFVRKLSKIVKKSKTYSKMHKFENRNLVVRIGKIKPRMESVQDITNRVWRCEDCSMDFQIKSCAVALSSYQQIHRSRNLIDDS